ncbi:MAG: hypothetical protein WCG42_00410 [Parachlamydiaceae bacterium]
MTSLLKQPVDCSIEYNIQSHVGWIGHVSGLYADKLMRKIKTPYQYVLRQGETEFDYYVSFVQQDGTVKHQPFEITLAPEGWYYENSGAGGPFVDATIDDVLHLIMHCDQGECTPLVI